MSTAASLGSSPVALPAEYRPWRDALPPAAVASAFFLSVYSFCNWVTSRRPDVPTWHFGWERHIPFVPWMMGPYLSVDVLFVVAFFLCTSRRELWTHFRRIISANVIAAVCFVLFPLRMEAHRPEHVEGLLAPFVRLLYAFDRPYNLVPSLHIAQGLLIWVIFARHTRGPSRWLVHGWFILIGLSTLFTWQHAVPDVLTGWMLGMLCWWMWPDSGDLPNADCGLLNRIGRQDAASCNPRVGWRWAGGAALGVLLGYLLRPWGWLLLWPAFQCAVVAGAYFGLGPAVFRKSQGRHPPATLWLFFPLLLVTRIVRHFIHRAGPPWAALAPGVVVGRQLTVREARRLIERENITAVLDLTAECSESPPLRELTYLNIPLLDLMAPSPREFQQAMSFLHEQSRTGTVYVHCALGYTRAAGVAAAYLLTEGLCDTVDGAVAHVRALRPRIVLKQDAIIALEAYASARRKDVNRKT